MLTDLLFLEWSFKMAIPAYHWLKDDGGTDNMTGKITGTRVHSALVFEKEFDSSSPHLYKAVAKGQTLKSAEFKWYKINDAGHIGIKSPWHNTGVLMNAKKNCSCMDRRNAHFLFNIYIHVLHNARRAALRHVHKKFWICY
jgi:hypothetical protein